MKPLKENSGILPTKALPFSLINKIKISPQLSNTLDILNQNVYKVWGYHAHVCFFFKFS